jgi:hypothetical protein
MVADTGGFGGFGERPAPGSEPDGFGDYGK